MENTPARILIVDDNPAIHKDFAKIFNPPDNSLLALDEAEAAIFGGASAGSAQARNRRDLFELTGAIQGQEALLLVEESLRENQPFSVAFIDMRMPPGWDGVQTLQALWKADPNLQAVICTAYSDYSWDQMCEKLGKSDSFLILKKPFDVAEVQQMAAALTRKWKLARQAEMKISDMENMVAARTAALEQSLEQFSMTFHAAPMPQALFRFRDGACLDVNPAFCRLTGHSQEEWREDPLKLLHETHLVAAAPGPHPLQGLEISVTEGARNIRASVYTQKLNFGSGPCLLLMAQDNSERARLEEQLRHAQKMEAVGQLAAGIAHDFNNILTVIQGNLSLFKGNLTNPGSSPFDAEAFDQTFEAAKRAAALTRQLLTFSRKQVFQPVGLDINELLQRQTKLMSRILDAPITVESKLAPDLPRIHGDALSIEQVIINLAINARDAMPGGGRMTISSALAPRNSLKIPGDTETVEGDYVRVTVTDSGHGMDEAILGRIFEPFFTTKSVGKGTGMGLAIVYATLQQHKGWIIARSVKNQGSSFEFYLPVSQTPLKTEGEKITIPAETGTLAPLNILLVEDDFAVRTVMHKMLTRNGCKVFESEDAEQGFLCWQENREEIDLVITDIVMPGGQTGEDMARRILAIDPMVNVIYCSGYSPSLFEHGSGLVNCDNFIAKPYEVENINQLLHKVRDSHYVIPDPEPVRIGVV